MSPSQQSTLLFVLLCPLCHVSGTHSVYNMSFALSAKHPVFTLCTKHSVSCVSLCTEHCVHYIVCPWLLSAVSCQLNTQPNIGCHADLADTPRSSQLQLYRVTVIYKTLLHGKGATVL